MDRSASYRKFLATTVTTAIVATSAVSFSPAVFASNFQDVKANKFYTDAVERLTEVGFIQGISNAQFGSTEPLRRGDAAVLFQRVFLWDTSQAGVASFADVAKGAYYNEAVAQAVKMNVISGKSHNHFAPNDYLTRGEMAVLLTRVLNLQVDPNIDVPFVDIAGHPFEKEMKAIYQAGLTVGETATTFNPSRAVTRAEFATFLYRSEVVREHIEVKQYNKAENLSKIQALTDNTVTIGGATYQLSDNMRKLLNKENERALVNAYISFKQIDQTITDITFLALTNQVDLNGNDVEINGDVIVLSDRVALENMIIAGDLIVGKQARESFTGKKVEVKGTTNVAGGSAEVLIRNTTGANITFIDSSLESLNLYQDDVSLNLSGTTPLANLGVYANNITITSQEPIPSLTIGANVSEMTLNGDVTNLIVSSTVPFTLSGSGNIASLTVANGTFTANMSGTIASLTLTDANAKIVIGPNTRITNLVLPDGVEAKDVISDYDKVKGNIEQISGMKNPDVTEPSSSSNTGGSSDGGNSGGNSGGGGNNPGTGVQPEVAKMTVTSDFIHNEEILTPYSFEGDNQSLPVSWTPVAHAKSYAFIMYDLDADDASVGPYVHWVVKDIDKGVTEIAAGLSRTKTMPGVELPNFLALSPLPKVLRTGYVGPWPPEEHRYTIAVYALNSSEIHLSADEEGIITKAAFERAIKDKVIGKGEITGTYTPTLTGEDALELADEAIASLPDVADITDVTPELLSAIVEVERRIFVAMALGQPVDTTKLVTVKEKIATVTFHDSFKALIDRYNTVQDNAFRDYIKIELGENESEVMITLLPFPIELASIASEGEHEDGASAEEENNEESETIEGEDELAEEDELDETEPSELQEEDALESDEADELESESEMNAQTEVDFDAMDIEGEDDEEEEDEEDDFDEEMNFEGTIIAFGILVDSLLELGVTHITINDESLQINEAEDREDMILNLIFLLNDAIGKSISDENNGQSIDVIFTVSDQEMGVEVDVQYKIVIEVDFGGEIE